MKKKPNVTRQIIGIIVIAVIGFNIYRACSGNTEPKSTETALSAAPKADKNSYYNQYMADAEANTPKNTEVTDKWTSTRNRLVYRTTGDDELSYYWIVTSINGSVTFEYIIADNEGYTTLKKGDCDIMKFSQLQSQFPEIYVSAGSISDNSNIMLMGPIDQHIDWAGNSRDVFAILVPNNKTAKIYINDTDDPNEFMLLDNLRLQR